MQIVKIEGLQRKKKSIYLANACRINVLILGFFWRELMTDTGAEPDSWKYLAVCVPIVVFFAPFGSFLSSHFHRQVLAALIYILDTIALVIHSY